jgi:hypothetical protein
VVVVTVFVPPPLEMMAAITAPAAAPAMTGRKRLRDFISPSSKADSNENPFRKW